MPTMTTLITCYYRFPSKHPDASYDGWIQNFLAHVSRTPGHCSLVVFTSAVMAPFIERGMRSLLQEKRAQLLIRELEDLRFLKDHGSILEEQHRIDPQRSIRTKECYVVWNSKLDLVKQVIETNPFGATRFVWSDIGNVRHPERGSGWRPTFQNIDPERVDIVLVKPFSDEEQGQTFFFDTVHFSGSIMGGSRDAFLALHALYYDTVLVEYLAEGRFIGCDQQLLASAYMKRPDLFHVLIPPPTERVDPWFYLHRHYSEPDQGSSLCGPGIARTTSEGDGRYEGCPVAACSAPR